eukprot:7391449-Prymnesium_polylepis.1
MHTTSACFSQRSTVASEPDSSWRSRPSAATCSEYVRVIPRTLPAPELSDCCRTLRSRKIVLNVKAARVPFACRCSATLTHCPSSACNASLSAFAAFSSAALASAHSPLRSARALARLRARAIWLRLAFHVAVRDERCASSLLCAWSFSCNRCVSCFSSRRHSIRFHSAIASARFFWQARARSMRSSSAAINLSSDAWRICSPLHSEACCCAVCSRSKACCRFVCSSSARAAFSCLAITARALLLASARAL